MDEDKTVEAEMFSLPLLSSTVFSNPGGGHCLQPGILSHRCSVRERQILVSLGLSFLEHMYSTPGDYPRSLTRLGFPRVLCGAEGAGCHWRWLCLSLRRGRSLVTLFSVILLPPVRHKGLHGFLSVNRGSPDGKCVLLPLAQAGV